MRTKYRKREIKKDLQQAASLGYPREKMESQAYKYAKRGFKKKVN